MLFSIPQFAQSTFDIYYAIMFLAVLIIAGMILGKLAEKLEFLLLQVISLQGF